MNRKKTGELIIEICRRRDIMQAYCDGDVIESKPLHGKKSKWAIDKNPKWDFNTTEYRVKNILNDYREYQNPDELKKEIEIHGDCVYNKIFNEYFSLGYSTLDFIYCKKPNMRFHISVRDLMHGCTWADDGTPCGILIKEEN